MAENIKHREVDEGKSKNKNKSKNNKKKTRRKNPDNVAQAQQDNGNIITINSTTPDLRKFPSHTMTTANISICILMIPTFYPLLSKKYHPANYHHAVPKARSECQRNSKSF